MCKILGAIGITDHQKLEDLISLNQKSLEDQPDGFAFVSDKAHLRSLRYLWKHVQFDKFFVIHTRIATTGRVCAENAHGFRRGDWTFSHNGTAAPYTPVTGAYGYGMDLRQKKTDSEEFFELLIEEGITHENIEACIKETGFWGIGVLANKKENRLILFSKNKYINLLADDHGGGLVFSSYEVENEFGVDLEQYGLEFEGKNQRVFSHEGVAYNEIMEFEISTGQLIGHTELAEPAKVSRKPGSVSVGDPVRDAEDFVSEIMDDDTERYYMELEAEYYNQHKPEREPGPVFTTKGKPVETTKGKPTTIVATKGIPSKTTEVPMGKGCQV